MQTTPLTDYGFTEDQMEMLPGDFVKFTLSYYNAVELKTLSTAAIIKGASMLYNIYHPEKQPIVVN